MSARVPLTVVIPALNEEATLPSALKSVAWATEVIVVDSNSSDATAAVAERAGARVVQFEYSGTGPKKKAWAIQNLEFANDWVFFLDADERVPAALQAEIGEAIASKTVDGLCVDRELVFLGRPLRCFRPNWAPRLFRVGYAHMEDLGLSNLAGIGDNEIHEHLVIEGRVGYLKHPLVNDEDRGLTAWIAKHNRYATWEAALYEKLRSEPTGVGPMALLRLDPHLRKRALRRLWVRLPAPARPVLRFLVWYVGRRGFMDGVEGLAYCLLMAWYELVIALKLRELDRSVAAPQN